MLLPNTNHLMIHQVEYEKRIKEIERRHWLREAAPQQALSIQPYRQALNWLGTQMVKMGAKLQSLETVSPSGVKVKPRYGQ